MKIQVANGEYPNKRLWLELPISDDPDWIKTTGKLAALAAPGQTEVSLRVKDVECPVSNLKRYILADNGRIAISQVITENNRIIKKARVNHEKIVGFHQNQNLRLCAETARYHSKQPQ